MREALKEAKKAYKLGEVPIGAIVVEDGEIVGRGHNLTETERNPVLHAEMVALRQAVQEIGRWRLTKCSMYVTCEPCAMCAGAIVWSRIKDLYIGTMDPKAGACGSVLNVACNPDLNHRVRLHVGMCQEECSKILKEFFSELRMKKKTTRQLEE